MSRYYSYLNTAKQIVNDYKGTEPLSGWLKKFYADRKQMGSRDRREVSQLVYQYYRLGNACKNEIIENRFAISIFLCNDQPSELLNLLKPEWNQSIKLPRLDKMAMIDGFDSFDIFPSIKESSIEWQYKSSFCDSHLFQPDLYLRIRPKQIEIVIQKLTANNIDFVQLSATCLVLDNTTKVDTILLIDKEVVIQDYSSQMIGYFLNFFMLLMQNKPKTLKVWDCCAASGGKSILAVDVLGKVNLTVSDIRESIIHNLRKRFERAGISQYQSFVIDVSKEVTQFQKQKFDLIICDAPCSGSGTWGRTPENLVHFKREQIFYYSNLQKQIASNVIASLNECGYLLYITCSVYEEENEGVVTFLLKKFPELELKKQELLLGYALETENRADSMFAALFKYN